VYRPIAVPRASGVNGLVGGGACGGGSTGASSAADSGAAATANARRSRQLGQVRTCASVAAMPSGPIRASTKATIVSTSRHPTPAHHAGTAGAKPEI